MSSFDLNDSQNQFQQQGGFAKLVTNQLEINNCSFTQSTADKGSFLYIESLSFLLKIVINKSFFNEGFSKSDGSAIFINTPEYGLDLSILNSQFSNIFSSSQESYIISIKYPSLSNSTSLNQVYLDNIQIANIFGNINSAFINIINTQFIMQDILISQKIDYLIPKQLINQGFSQLQQLQVVQSQNSSLAFYKFIFNNLIQSFTTEPSLFIKSDNSNISISYSNFTNLKFGKSLIDITNGVLVIKNSIFQNITQIINSKQRLVQSSYMPFLSNQNSLIRLMNSVIYIYDHSIFDVIICQQDCQGSTLFLDYSQFQIMDTNFTNQRTSKGGVISIIGLKKSQNSISNCQFISNKAQLNGGALYLQANQDDEFKLEINSTQFSQNSVQQGYGGALFLISQISNTSKQQILINDSLFQQNEALIGGTLYNQGINPYFQTSIFKKNVAIYYGDDQFSYPNQLYLFNYADFNNQYDYVKQKIILNKFKSGGTLPDFIFQLKDNTLKPIISIQGQILQVKVQISNQTQDYTKFQISGDTYQNIDNSGKFIFSGLKFVGIPGSKAFLDFSSDSIKVYNNKTMSYDQNYTYRIEVNFRNCTIGEIINKYNLFQECQACDNGKYTFDFSSCLPCVDGGICEEGLIYLKSGYWREEQYSPNIFECINRQNNCVGQSFGNEVCIQGHIGPLCEECDIFGNFWKESYTKKQKYECIQCQQFNSYIWKLIITPLLIFLCMQVTVQNNERNQLEKIINNAFYQRSSQKQQMQRKFQEKQKSRIYIKVLINYVQIIANSVTFNQMFGFKIFETFIFFGSPISSQIDYIDCFLKNNHFQFPLIYQKLIISVSSLIGLIAIYFLYEIVVQKIIYRTKKMIYYSFYTATIFLFLFLQPDLVSQMIGLLACRKVGDSEYILLNMNYKCFTKQYQMYSLGLVIPILIIVVVILPLILLILIKNIKQTNKLDKAIANLKYGFIYQEYKSQNYYWEFVKMIEKIAIIIVINIYSQNIKVKGILSYLIILFYGMLSSKIQPYQLKELNQVDSYSAKLCGLTVIISVLISNSQFLYLDIIGFMLICIFNLCFIVIMIFRIIQDKHQSIRGYCKSLIKCKFFSGFVKHNKKENLQLKQKLKKALLKLLAMNSNEKQILFKNLQIKFEQKQQDNQDKKYEMFEGIRSEINEQETQNIFQQTQKLQLNSPNNKSQQIQFSSNDFISENDLQIQSSNLLSKKITSSQIQELKKYQLESQENFKFKLNDKQRITLNSLDKSQIFDHNQLNQQMLENQAEVNKLESTQQINDDEKKIQKQQQQQSSSSSSQLQGEFKSEKKKPELQVKDEKNILQRKNNQNPFTLNSKINQLKPDNQDETTSDQGIYIQNKTDNDSQN